ncbi:MAG: methyl-accepting chemotaxis sensory transducer [Tardiphaga sp.]|jgi:methyl-accepting chemotaxis protein|nr:methyl-accepting chemotaxis sensory transducer [Tardiphaga sp.]
MARLNSIGAKLGLAGVVGILFTAGMIANQMISEAAIRGADDRAERQQLVATHVFEADIALRRMQVAARDIRLARIPADVETARAAMLDGRSRAVKEIELALERSYDPERKERLNKLKSLAVEYGEGVSGVADLQTSGFALIAKRQEFSAQFGKSMAALTATAGEENRADVEKMLLEAQSKFDVLRAAVLRLQATGEDDQKAVIASRAVEFGVIAQKLKGLMLDSRSSASADALSNSLTSFVAANADVVTAEAAKTKQVQVVALPIGARAVELARVAVDIANANAAASRVQAQDELAHSNRISFWLAVFIVASLIGSAIFTFLGVSRPLTRLNGALGKIASGEIGVEIPGASRGDEVGDIAKTVVVISANTERKAREEAAAKIHQDKDIAEQRKRDMKRLADEFENAVGEIVETVSSAATELEASAGSLTATADRSEELTTMVAAASEEASTSVQSVASATEEMASSVNEISRQVQDSARIAGEAVAQAEETNQRIGQLAKAAGRIGDVVELINSIAGQTNLLALNATIEAARAGEAGRGFAVVASEVKALAEQTAKATGEISQQIAGMQAATQASVEAIRDIGTTIGKMSEISSTIASAVEEQGAATQEISRNVQQAAQGTMQVSSNIGDVRRGASETGSASSQVLSAAQSLSVESNRLKVEVNRFLDSVRAA